MRACRFCADVIVTLVVVVANVAVLPIRLCAALVGGVLVFAGLVGLPVWLVQFAISAAGGGNGGGPLSPWEMCGLLAVAIAGGLGLLQLANLGLGSGSTGSGDELDRSEVTALDAHGPVGAATGRFPVPADVSEATVVLASARVEATLGRLVRHELRLRAMSQQIAAHKRRRRGEHQGPRRPAP